MGLTNLDISCNPELSGGVFDGQTCSQLVIGNEGNLNELTLPSNSTVSLVQSIPIIGGSGDTEGVCFWYNQTVGEKIVVVDEQDRSGKLPKLHNFLLTSSAVIFIFHRIQLPFVTYLVAILLFHYFMTVQIVED